MDPTIGTMLLTDRPSVDVETLRSRLYGEVYGPGDAGWDGLSETLHKRLSQAHEGLNFRIERAGEGELPRFELKAKRTIDKRDAPIGAPS